MVELESLYRDFKEGRKTLIDVRKVLMLTIYKNRALYGIINLSEDDFMNFLTDFSEKIFSIIESYNENLCKKFGSYFYFTVRTYYTSWRQKRSRKITLENSMLQEEYNAFEEECELYCRNEYCNSFRAKPDQETPLDILEKCMKEKNILSKKKDLFFRETLLILALKSAPFITYEIELKLCEVLEIKLEDMDNLLQEALKHMEVKINRMQTLNKARDKAYRFHRQYIFENKALDEGCQRYSYTIKHYKTQTERWENQKKLIQKHMEHYSPSNKTISKLLDLDERHISYVLRNASKNIDSLTLKWYSHKHENLPSNRKHEQETGDE